MSQQAIRGYYQLTTLIEKQLRANGITNVVSIGDISKVNLNKQDIFPLAHIIVNNAALEENVIRFNVSILACDIVDQSKDITTDSFVGNDNEQDILNTQLAVINNLTQKMRIGNLHQDKYQIESGVSAQPFMDRFENQLAGWTATMDILIYNDIDICS
jgi:hypothetical protein